MTIPLLFRLMNPAPPGAGSLSNRGGRTWPASQSTCTGTFLDVRADDRTIASDPWDAEELARARTAAAGMMGQFEEAERILARIQAGMNALNRPSRALAQRMRRAFRVFS
jgi:hypothetical protein